MRFAYRGGLLTGFFLLIAALCSIADPPPEPPHVRPEWDYDSLWPDPVRSASSKDAQLVNEALATQEKCWNAHDLDGFLAVYWKSADVLYVTEGQQIVGWQKLHDALKIGFRDPRDMGFLTTARVRIRLIHPDLAFALTSWAVTFPRTVNTLAGTDTALFKKFGDGWKIIVGHSSAMDL